MLPRLRAEILFALGLTGCPPEATTPPTPPADAATTATNVPPVETIAPPAGSDAAPVAIADASPPMPSATIPSPSPASTSWYVEYPTPAPFKQDWCPKTSAECMTDYPHETGTQAPPSTAFPGCRESIAKKCGCAPGTVCQDPNKMCDFALVAQVTKEQRVQKDKRACCYQTPMFCMPPWAGRTLCDGDARVVARTVERDGWSTPGRARIEFRDLAAAEHASIASFSRVSLALLAHGAPADLIVDTHRAALDEIEHARAMYGLASGEAPLGPSALSTEPFVVPSLLELIASTFEDACIAEARGALLLATLAADECDRETASLLRQIHEDELRHVVLAWRTLAWTLERAGDAGHTVLETKLAALGGDALVREVIRPCASALLSSSHRAARTDSRRLPGDEPRAHA